eukprot:759732-Alexandrium_andersonii.AAC.1
MFLLCVPEGRPVRLPGLRLAPELGLQGCRRLPGDGPGQPPETHRAEPERPPGFVGGPPVQPGRRRPVSYTHLRAHETSAHL